MNDFEKLFEIRYCGEFPDTTDVDYFVELELEKRKLEAEKRNLLAMKWNSDLMQHILTDDELNKLNRIRLTISDIRIKQKSIPRYLDVRRQALDRIYRKENTNEG